MSFSRICAAIKLDNLSINSVAAAAEIPQSSLQRFCAGSQGLQMVSLVKVCEFLELELVRRVNLDEHCEAIWQEHSGDWWKDYGSDAWKEYEGDAWKEALEEIEREADSVPTDPNEYEEWSVVEYDEWYEVEYPDWLKVEQEEWKSATRSDLWADEYNQLSSQDWVILDAGNYVP